MPRDPREERNGHVLGERKPPEEEDEVDEEDALARAPETLCDDLWTVLGACLRSNGIVRHQIEAFNNFLLKLMPQIVRDHAPITIRDDERGESHVIRMDNARLQGPVAVETDGRRVPMSHTMAMRRNAAYCVTILMDMVHDVYEGEEHVERRVFRDVTLCAMPLMVGSAACYRFRTRDDEAALNENDAGGYFVINGVEKVLIAQERLRTNAPFVFPMSGHPKYQLQCEIRSCAEHKLKSTSTFVVYLTRERQGDDLPELLGSLPFIMQSSLPLQTMFRLIGVTSRDDMINLITGGVGGIPTTYVSSFLVDDGLETMDEETLYEHIAKDATSEPTRERRHRYMDHVLRSEFLPHMGTDGSALTRRRKAQYLGFMVRKLVQVYRGESEPDNRDDYSVKRIDASPCSMLFRQIHRAMVKSMCSTLVRVRESGKLKWTDVSKLWPGKRMSQALRYAFSTGSWGMQIAHRSNGNTSSNTALSASNTGITQVLSRMSMTSTMSNLRRTNTPIAREGKAPKPRQLHTSAWGLVCAVETPEGISCGLVKNLALTTHVRVGVPSTQVVDLLLHQCGDAIVPLSAPAFDECAANGIVVVNGTIVGASCDAQSPRTILTTMRECRKHGSLPFDTTIAKAPSGPDIVIDTDSGCLLRPIVPAESVDLLHGMLRELAGLDDVTVWQRLVDTGTVVYVDKQEEANYFVGIDPSKRRVATTGHAYTHFELRPSVMFGVCAALIPFPDHSQSPRNTYQAAMGKQAIGRYALDDAVRFDTIGHTLCQPQRPLVCTRFERLLGLDRVPCGVNVICAIAVRGGYNQEDSVILNRASVERGLFQSVKICTYRDEERATGTDNEKFENSVSSAATNIKIANYGTIDEAGCARVGQVLDAGDVVIGKTVGTADAESILKGHRNTVKRDKSVIVRSDAHVVDAVLHSHKTDGTRLVKLRTRQVRTPAVGDKFSSRMGQKGICGRLLNAEDMPYTSDGLVPDILVNPHAMPSRMTIGQLIETLLGRLAVCEGTFGDATPFSDMTVDAIGDALETHGCDRHGNETMYDALSGMEFESKVFVGPTFYQRLKHMAADKIHQRARGPRQVLTHQPLEGRARDGGLRMGECVSKFQRPLSFQQRTLRTHTRSMTPATGVHGTDASGSLSHVHIRTPTVCRMERDCLISHGVHHVLQERLMLVSDPFDAHICSTCGHFAHAPVKNALISGREATCSLCNSSRNISVVTIPFACKLLLQELQGMHIGVRLVT